MDDVRQRIILRDGHGLRVLNLVAAILNALMLSFYAFAWFFLCSMSTPKGGSFFDLQPLTTEIGLLGFPLLNASLCVGFATGQGRRLTLLISMVAFNLAIGSTFLLLVTYPPLLLLGSPALLTAFGYCGLAFAFTRQPAQTPLPLDPGASVVKGQEEQGICSFPKSASLSISVDGNSRPP
jgi:hypothetical protein